MKATLILYIVMGALFLVPLILFNIRRIFVRKPPAPLKINWGRGLFVVLFSAFLVFFLVCAYRTTMESRYEIAAERIAEQHASMLAGNQSAEDFRQYVLDNGTEDVSESLRETGYHVPAIDHLGRSITDTHGGKGNQPIIIFIFSDQNTVE